MQNVIGPLVAKPVRMTATGQVRTGKSLLLGFQVGTDGTNDPTITIYNGVAAVAGNAVVPTQIYEASDNTLRGMIQAYKYCPDGVYIAMPNIS